MIKMVVFDMAGTVINEDNVVYKTLLRTVNEHGYDLSLDQVLAEGAGKEKFQAIKDVLQKYTHIYNEEVADRLFQNFKIYLAEAYATLEIKPQPGAEEVFGELKRKGIHVVVTTGYDLTTAQSILTKVGWEEGKQFDGLATASHVLHSRPKPDMIVFAKKKFGLSDSAQVVKIGDSIIDIEEGRNAKCKFSIGITTGAQTREQLLKARPDYIIDHLLEILPLIEKR